MRSHGLRFDQGSRGIARTSLDRSLPGAISRRPWLLHLKLAALSLTRGRPALMAGATGRGPLAEDHGSGKTDHLGVHVEEGRVDVEWFLWLSLLV